MTLQKATDIRFSVLSKNDIAGLIRLTRNHVREDGYFEQSLVEQLEQKRTVILAHEGGVLAGYAHLNRFPKYLPFRRLNIPEIQDLFVHPDFRRKGIGGKLVRACEQQAQKDGAEMIGLGVGIGSDFGEAQRLYVRMGYLPDGAGAVFDRLGISNGDVRPIDERICLMLMKDLPQLQADGSLTPLLPRD